MPKISNFAQANHYLARFYEYSRVDYTLDNMLKLMKFLDNPQEKFKVIHVAGTSGKTSTAYYISSLLATGGYKTGLTVSPHIDQLNERVQINNHPVPEAEFCSELSQFLEIIEESKIKPSWFETMVAFAYWYFAKQEVQYVVVEVGLGGLKDGTNVIRRFDKVCVITDIGFDHVGVLGESLKEITGQKAGIIQPGNTVFTYRQTEEITGAIKKKTEAMKAKLKIVDDFNPKDFKKRNWRLAHAVYEYLGERDNLRYLTSQELARTQHLQIPGRMEIKRVGKKVLIMDGAHNDQKMTAFITSFRRHFPQAKPAILIGVKEGKEYRPLVDILKPIAGRIITTTFTASQDLQLKSMDPELLAAAFRNPQLDAKSVPDQRAAFKALLSSPEDVLMIMGSFYLLGQIRNNEKLA